MRVVFGRNAESGTLQQVPNTGAVAKRGTPTGNADEAVAQSNRGALGATTLRRASNYARVYLVNFGAREKPETIFFPPGGAGARVPI